MTKLRFILLHLSDFLRGEPLRAIIYGAAGVWFFAALALDRIPDMAFDEAVVSATAVLGSLVGAVEWARRLVTPLDAPVLPLGTIVSTPDTTTPPNDAVVTSL